MAASRIKGITVEIGGDTTKLQTALQGVNKEIKSTQSQLKDVEKLLKLDPGNTELLAQKQQLLSSAVKETKEKLETLKTAAEQANTALANGDISQAQYLHFSVPDIGPLTEYESWMPDFMKGLAEGIEKSRSMVEKAIGHVSSDLVLNPEIGSLKSGVFGGGSGGDGSVTVNVPLFLDGKQITSATSTIQTQLNISYRRSLGVV